MVYFTRNTKYTGHVAQSARTGENLREYKMPTEKDKKSSKKEIRQAISLQYNSQCNIDCIVTASNVGARRYEKDIKRSDIKLRGQKDVFNKFFYRARTRTNLRRRLLSCALKSTPKSSFHPLYIINVNLNFTQATPLYV